MSNLWRSRTILQLIYKRDYAQQSSGKQRHDWLNIRLRDVVVNNIWKSQQDFRNIKKSSTSSCEQVSCIDWGLYPGGTSFESRSEI